jgi:photosystem II stability/assembly factor-like uncharacterized protein
LFLIVSVVVLLAAVQRMAASSITDSALHSDGIQALFIAESGLEHAAWRYDTGYVCSALSGETGNIGRGSFTVLSAGFVGSDCRVRVMGRVTTTIVESTAIRIIEGDFNSSTKSGGWAIGKKDDDALLLNYDGTDWSQSGAYAGIPDKDLYAVSCINANDCWAVGDDDGGELIIHWDGSNWSRSGPYPGIPDEKLNSVHCVASNDCWAVGNDKDGELIIHWNGSNWSRSGPYSGIPDEKLNSVHCVSSNDCWAVGEDKNGELIIRWNGSSWSRAGPYGSVANKNLTSVHCASSNHCWAVGEKDGYENINFWNGTTWRRIGNTPGLDNDDLYGVYMVSETEGYLVGKDGSMAIWDGSSWTGQPALTDKDLLAIAGYDGTNDVVKVMQWSEVIQ